MKAVNGKKVDIYMSADVRTEDARDFAAIRALLDQAFGGDYESQLVERIRAGPDYIKELSLVAEVNGCVAGHIMISYVSLQNVESSRQVLSLGPVAVAPQFQNAGIGSLLIRAALERADTMTADTMVLLGHANYYPRFGFRTASQLDIYPPLPWGSQNFMARQAPWSCSIAGGVVHYPKTWGIDQTGGAEKRFRAATERDIAQIARVFKISFRYALPYLPKLHTDEEDLEYFSRNVFKENQIYVAESIPQSTSEEPVILGFIAFDRTFVNQLYVLPFACRRLLGSKLLSIAKEERRQLKLWAFQRNKPAIKFYERHGFVQIRKTDGRGNEEKEPDVLMEWQA